MTNDAAEDFHLFLGTKNWSSWSLRPWLLMKAKAIPFSETEIQLRAGTTKAALAEISPSGLVPTLRHGDLVLWDSLAIMEYLGELYPDRGLWPFAPETRALARSVAHEMHSGFGPLRQNMPMDCLGQYPGEGMTDEVAANIKRIEAVWTDMRTRFAEDGPFLFGHFTIADAMYAPVVSRFLTYEVKLNDTARAYCDTVWGMDEIADWLQGCTPTASD
mgnify:CR=1 FL=1